MQEDHPTRIKVHSIPGFLGAPNTGGGGLFGPPQRKPTLLPRRLAKRGPHSLMVEMSV